MAEPVKKPAVAGTSTEVINLDPDPTTDEPGFDLDEEGMVAVAGLLIPPVLALQIVASMRAIYPTVTEGLDDPAAVRAVLRFWVTATLEQYASQQVTTNVAEQVAAIQTAAEEKGRKVREEAAKAAQTIKEVKRPSRPAPETATDQPADPS